LQTKPKIPLNSRAISASSNFRQLYREEFTVLPFELVVTFKAEVFDSVENLLPCSAAVPAAGSGSVSLPDSNHNKKQNAPPKGRSVFAF
jgi:hypothetical protein